MKSITVLLTDGTETVVENIQDAVWREGALIVYVTNAHTSRIKTEERGWPAHSVFSWHMMVIRD